nr:hypothetical protein [Neisseria meningitidis]
GGGIMSATLGVLLKELEPSWEITLIERLEDVAFVVRQITIRAEDACFLGVNHG